MSKNWRETGIRNKVILLTVGFVLFVASIIATKLLRDFLPEILLPNTMKQYFISYTVKTADGIEIPVTTERITNNGKLFAFCNGLSAVLVSFVFYLVGKKVYNLFYKKFIRADLSKTIRLIEVFVAILAVFTFASKVNPDNNIEKYEIKFNSGSYEKETKSYDEQGLELIGFLKKADFQSDKELVPVFKSPVLESAPTEKGNDFEKLFVFYVRNIGKISNYSEILTIALGVCLLVLNSYQKRVDDVIKEKRK